MPWNRLLLEKLLVPLLVMELHIFDETQRFITTFTRAHHMPQPSARWIQSMLFHNFFIWFDNKCSKFSEQMKQHKLKWLQNLNWINTDNLNNVVKLADIAITKRRNIHNAKLMNLKQNSETCTKVQINSKMVGYQPGTHVVNDNKCDFVTNSWSILNGWKNHFCQLLDEHILDRVKYV